MKKRKPYLKFIFLPLLLLAALPVMVIPLLLAIDFINHKIPNISQPVKELIPISTKEALKEVVVEIENIPRIFDKNKQSRYQLLSAIQEYRLANYKVLSLPQTQFLDLELTRLPFDSSKIESGYIDIVNERIIITSRLGRTFYFDPRSTMATKKLALVEIKNNITSVFSVNSDNGSSNEYPTPLLIADSLVHKGSLYISIGLKRKKDCFNSAILRAPMDFDNLVFEIFFTYDECVAISRPIGGRMAITHNGERLLFTVADVVPPAGGSGLALAQSDKSIFGKTISISLLDKTYTIFSKGHRNPQGLLVVENKILSTEHGPDGGDEINSIKQDLNYGWPIASYGETENQLTERPPLHYRKSHVRFGYEEPLYVFAQSIGISQIITIPNEFSERWQDSYFISSLNGRKLFRLIFDRDFTRVISSEPIYIGQRIRDLVYDKNTSLFFLTLETPGTLGILGIHTKKN